MNASEHPTVRVDEVWPGMGRGEQWEWLIGGAWLPVDRNQLGSLPGGARIVARRKPVTRTIKAHEVRPGMVVDARTVSSVEVVLYPASAIGRNVWGWDADVEITEGPAA